MSALDAFAVLHKPIRQQLEKIGIAEPSDIQRLAIPDILAGKNVLVIAPTGTGKTLASILPILHSFIDARSKDETHGISILYVTPLRALNRDILRRLLEVCQELDIKVQVRHGDTAARVRALQARLPPNLLITTPETLQAILTGRRMRQHLRGIRWVVVDEIHELATDKRGSQLAVALERLHHLTERDFQRVGLSATVGDPQKIARFLVGANRHVGIAKTEESKNFDVWVESLAPSDADTQQAKKLGLPASSVARVRRIDELIRQNRSTLVFTNTREHAEAIGSQLVVLDEKTPVRVHHGSLSREIREEVEQGFNEGKIKGVVCTSSLELGIDVGSVDFIIQYMSPRESTRLIQRIGRSGHRLTGTPRGTIIATLADDILESAVLAKNARDEVLEEPRVHYNPLDVLAHQIVGTVLEGRGVTLDQISETVKRAYPFSDLSKEVFDSSVQQLVSARIIKISEGRTFPAFPRSWKYYYENLSMIPDVKRFTVFDFIRKRRLGTLDQEYVARRCKPGAEFIMHGQTWKVVATDEEALKVEVEPTAPSLHAIPSWEGEIIPVSYMTATEVGRLRRFIATNLDNDGALADFAKSYTLGEHPLQKVRETIRSHLGNFPLPTDTALVIEKFENSIVLHACYGNLVNETLALALAALLSSRFGFNVATQTDAYRIALICPFKIEAEIIAATLRDLSPEQLETVLIQALELSDLFAWRHWHVARRFGLVEKTADYKTSRARLLVQALRDTPVNHEARREIFTEKVDLERAKEVIAKIGSGEISIQIVDQTQPTCSPLAMPIVDKIIPHDLLRPAVPTKSLVEVVKERLLSQTTRLVCLFNADWEGARTVRDLADKIKCPRCRSTLIAATYRSDDKLLPIAKRRKRGQQLTPEDTEEWNRAWHSASLIQNSGKRAIIALAGRGVGPVVATRILRRHIRNEDEFYVEILKAEREYARTRIFWD